MNDRTFMVEFGGKYGGFYAINENVMKRICLGWIAFTYIPCNLAEYTIAVEKMSYNKYEKEQSPLK